jgi:hypothetical protein
VLGQVQCQRRSPLAGADHGAMRVPVHRAKTTRREG